MSRYIPNTEHQQKEMLQEIGKTSMEELFAEIPHSIRLQRNLQLPKPLSEMDLMRHMRKLAEENENLEDYTCFLGAGAYDHFIPSIVAHVLSRQEFYTAYTPYQPEISQGMLQAIFEYQTMICEITGMEAANASMYDGATALAEAAAMACGAVRRSEVIVARSVHPESRAVLKTYARFNGIRVTEVGWEDGRVSLEELNSKVSSDTAAVIVQNPNFFGCLESLEEIGEIIHNHKGMLMVSADPISLALLKAPGSQGADVVVGEGQSLGSSLSFGGPYLGFFAAAEKLVRKMPGRIVGQTVDRQGQRGFVLTLQTREQHIRREKATSNICSNQALNALTAAVYMTVMGKKGLRETAELCLQKAHYTQVQLQAAAKAAPIFSAPFFKEFAVRPEVPVGVLNAELLKDYIIGGYSLDMEYPELKNGWLVAVTEKRTREEIDEFVGKVESLS